MATPRSSGSRRHVRALGCALSPGEGSSGTPGAHRGARSHRGAKAAVLGSTPGHPWAAWVGSSAAPPGPRLLGPSECGSSWKSGFCGCNHVKTGSAWSGGPLGQWPRPQEGGKTGPGHVSSPVTVVVGGGVTWPLPRAARPLLQPPAPGGTREAACRPLGVDIGLQPDLPWAVGSVSGPLPQLAHPGRCCPPPTGREMRRWAPSREGALYRLNHAQLHCVRLSGEEPPGQRETNRDISRAGPFRVDGGCGPEATGSGAARGPREVHGGSTRQTEPQVSPPRAAASARPPAWAEGRADGAGGPAGDPPSCQQSLGGLARS